MHEVSSQTPRKQRRALLAVFVILSTTLVAVLFHASRENVLGQERNPVSASSLAAAEAKLWPISIDYPEDGSIFPPGITPPTFLWRDAAAVTWRIDIEFAG